jgi:hypothetical protein
VRAESSISAMFYSDNLQVKHSYKVNELICHKLELDELKVHWPGRYFVTVSGLASWFV